MSASAVRSAFQFGRYYAYARNPLAEVVGIDRRPGIESVRFAVLGVWSETATRSPPVRTKRFDPEARKWKSPALQLNVIGTGAESLNRNRLAEGGELCMSYAVKEIFYTLQGEGRNAGRAAVFCRFSGCNLWSGRERDRERAICRFCDTEFVGMDGTGGGRYRDAEELAFAVFAMWSGAAIERPLVVLTGGEPLLQTDPPLLAALHAGGFEIAVETNGTLAAPPGIDWICVSPKSGALLRQSSGHELKLVYPQRGAEPELFVDLDFANFLLQPMDGPDVAENTALALAYCLRHPRWRLSLQTHKLLGIP